MADIPESTKMPHHTSISVEAAMEEMRSGNMQHWSGAIYDHLRNHAFLLETLATRAATPAIDREAVETAIRIGVWNACCDRGMSQETATAIVQAVVAQPIVTKALSTLSADSIRQGEGWQSIETAPRDGTWFIADGGGLNRPTPMKWCERVGAWEADAVMLEDWDQQAEGYSRPLFWIAIPGRLSATPASHASDGGK